MKIQHQEHTGRYLAELHESRKLSDTAKYHSEKSGHILSASANLMGICFIVLTSLKVLGKSNETTIDEMAAVCIVVFMSCCIFSFLSIRSIYKKGIWMENIADAIFLAGLLLLFVTALLFSFNIIQ